ncbi:DUF2783 domain-containing protein [Delftia acidovorans]|uniref:DUF2783 domain-containing protein n=1 Tax=Pseudomonadota TaxID=1224 RepID=UPI00241EA257|nr:DUF2783 domain-containing protein [Delftia acidovorans]
MSQAHTSPDTLDIAGLEAVYDQLATAIDAAGPQQSELFLVKLALLAAERLGSARQFSELVQAAQQDLQPRVNS